MPLHMHKLVRGKNKGKWIAREPSGNREYGPADRAAVRRYVQARNIAYARKRGHKIPRER